MDLKILGRKIKHARSRVDSLKESHGESPGQTHSYHGGWNLGYWEGKLSVYEDLLDENYKEPLEEGQKSKLPGGNEQ